MQALTPETFDAFCVGFGQELAAANGITPNGRGQAVINDEVLAPPHWDDYIGQARAKAELQIRTASAVARNARLPHTLLYGGPGTGKTTLARLMASEADLPIVVMNRPPKNNDALLDVLFGNERGVLFVDEIQNWGARQGALMQITEDAQLDTSSGPVYLPDLTVVAATTDRHKLTGAMRSRFECVPEFVDYTPEEMGRILVGMLERSSVTDVPDEVIAALAVATGGNPRMARRLAIATRDLSITGMPTTAEAVLSFTGVFHDGLTKEHVAYLRALGTCKHGTAGRETMATMLAVAPEEVRQLEEMLHKRGLISYAGSAGRQITPNGRRRLQAAGDA